MKKINIYTQAIKPPQNKKTEDVYLQNSTKKKLIDKLSQTPKETAVVLHDATHIKNKSQGETFYINDHINKTGENILRGKNHKFLDLTQIYTQHKRGRTTTCLGTRYEKNKKRHTTPSSNICSLAIMIKAHGFLNITGKLINQLK